MGAAVLGALAVLMPSVGTAALGRSGARLAKRPEWDCALLGGISILLHGWAWLLFHATDQPGRPPPIPHQIELQLFRASSVEPTLPTPAPSTKLRPLLPSVKPTMPARARPNVARKPLTPAISSPQSLSPTLLPPAPPDSSVRAAMSAQSTVPALLEAVCVACPPPIFPPRARQHGWMGKVILEVEVLPDGSIGHLKIAQTSGHLVLDEAALSAVQQWHYVPAKRGDSPVPVIRMLPIVFKFDH